MPYVQSMINAEKAEAVVTPDRARRTDRTRRATPAAAAAVSLGRSGLALPSRARLLLPPWLSLSSTTSSRGCGQAGDRRTEVPQR